MSLAAHPGPQLADPSELGSRPVSSPTNLENILVRGECELGPSDHNSEHWQALYL